MRELSLFTGAGGGVLGSKLLGWTTIGYVEINDYCQRVIAQRIKDGIFDEAPIFGDIRSFLSEGYASGYKGLVDVISAGFPCQPFSTAGRQEGEFDPRNMWPETIKVIRQVGPRYALLENVPGLLTDSYFGTILGDLAESGYDCKWTCLGADDLGGNHHRKRLWIFAYDNKIRCDGRGLKGEVFHRRESSRNEIDSGFEDASYPDKARISGQSESFSPSKALGQNGEGQAWGRTLTEALLHHVGIYGFTGRSGGDFEPPLRRTDDGLADGVDRIKAIGNGQVPIVAKTAWELLSS